jgi:hypothetical protein
VSVATVVVQALISLLFLRWQLRERLQGMTVARQPAAAAPSG